MESTLHAMWCALLIQSVRHTLADAGALVTGNTPFVPADGGPHTAPDLMVLPGLAGRQFGRYEVGRDGPPPSVCIEVQSPSNSNAAIARRLRRWLDAGVGEVYLIDPERDTLHRFVVVDGELHRREALGDYSPGLNLSFALVDRELALCCPGGRAVRLNDDPFGWLLDEQRRADEANTRADEANIRADEANTRADEANTRATALEAELRRLTQPDT